MTNEQQPNQPLTRRQLRELRSTGATPILTPEGTPIMPPAQATTAANEAKAPSDADDRQDVGQAPATADSADEASETGESAEPAASGGSVDPSREPAPAPAEESPAVADKGQGSGPSPSEPTPDPDGAPLTRRRAREQTGNTGALAVNKILDGKIGYLNLGLDVSPQCDCVAHADIQLTSHLGIYASHDPVAIDMACLDKATELPGMLGSGAEDWGVHGPGDHKFAKASALIPDAGVTEEIQLNTGVEIGLGTMDYELIDVPGSGNAQEYGFSFDRRPAGERFASMYAKENPFPSERHNGLGFDRKPKVDLEKVAGPLPRRK